MSRLRKLSTTALAVTALVPATAVAAQNELRGAPELRLTQSAQQAELQFNTDRRLSRSASGAYRLRISFVLAGQRVGKIVALGRHGDDYRYGARVTSDRGLTVGRKYRVRFTFPGQETTTRLVKVHPYEDRD